MTVWIILGLSGSIYAFGTNEAWQAVGLLLGTLVCWIIVPDRIRDYGIKTNTSHVAAFLTARFGKEKKSTGAVACCIMFFFYVFYLSAMMMVGGSVLLHLFSVPKEIGIFVTAVLTLGLSAFSDRKWTGWFSLFGWLFVLAGVLTVSVFCMLGIRDGGYVTRLLGSGLNESASEFLNIFTEDGHRISVSRLLSMLSFGLGFFGMPQIIRQYMGKKDDRRFQNRRRMILVRNFVMLSTACVVGACGRAILFPEVLTSESESYETLYLRVIERIFLQDYKLLPVAVLLFAGVLITILLTASMALTTTVDPFPKKKPMYLLIPMAPACCFALWYEGSMSELISFSWAGLSCAFGPVLLLSLYNRHITRAGCVSGMLSGAAFSVFWMVVKVLPEEGELFTMQEYTGIYAIFPAFFLSLLVTRFVSVCTKPVGEAELACFTEVKNGFI